MTEDDGGIAVPGTTAVVLGGGGLAGVGWSVGVLAALEEAGALRLTEAGTVIGTSAGSAVAAAVLQHGSASVEFDRLTRKSRRSAEPSPPVDLATVFPRVMQVHGAESSVAQKAAGFLAFTGEHEAGTSQLRRDAVARRVRDASWPAGNLVVTAVATDGRTRTFTRESGADLIDVLTASCAVPGLWPAVTIGGEQYLDGGTFSLTNAELAEGCERVIVLQPMPELAAYASPRRSAVLDRAVVLEPSERARAGFGPNPFDPDIRGVAAVLGYEDGLAAAKAVAASADRVAAR